ncbi:E3 ubiquitin-protein ligase RNF182 [Melanotaenia boesemani]|uniref:E3 ubiquitin-protein ligase RNF182 n=1 Tax=Melanotaenia boesemani TaxID=1250792 RepID=UPI001C043E7A|nr:E3 ubiquitin-protein ligase RNF182 [Melanotaenia boesemani]
MFGLQSSEDGSDGCGYLDLLSTEELECKICYFAYNLCSRRPKMLECCHRVCSKCLIKILDLGESPPNALVCPFCRYVTRLPGEAVNSLPDDCNLVATLALQSRNQRNLHFHQDATTELLLSPRRLSSLMGGNSPLMSPSSISPNFVVITIMEPPPASTSTQDLHHQHGSHTSNQGYRSSSLDSIASITQRWTVWNCAALLCQTSARALVWVLGLLYFSSLPMGVYLLIMQRTTVGVLLVSLVPASLIMIMIYGFCQCICHEFWDCMPP